MNESPIISMIALGVGGYLLYLWTQDLKSAGNGESGEAVPGSIPGATSASMLCCLAAGGLAVLLVSGITLVEWKLGLSDQQSTIRWFFLATMMGAAVTEEVIFRGYLVVRNRGRFMLILSVLFFSALFSLIHPFFWTHSVDVPAGFEWITALRFQWTPFSVFSGISIFGLSVFFYVMRFNPWNPKRSLLPCFCAHGVANLCVYVIKFAQGYVA